MKIMNSSISWHFSLPILIFAFLFFNNYNNNILPVRCDDFKPPRFSIDLNKPAKERWVDLARNYSEYAPLLLNFTNAYIPKYARPVIFYVASRLNEILELELSEEMEGVAQGFGLSIGEIVLLNLVYDVTAFDRACTSIIAQDSENRIWHGRNLDYGYQSLLKNMTILVDFRKNDKSIFTAITMPFSVGVLTGQNSQFAISLNERNKGPWWFNLAMAVLTKVRYPITFAIREALESSKTFEEAFLWLSKIPLMSPSYLAISGTSSGQGIILTRGRQKTQDFWFLEPYRNVWYLAETNFDHWSTSVKDDERRGKAEQILNETGRVAINADVMTKILSTRPIFNDLTLYSTVMSAANSNLIYDSTFIRN